MQGINHTKIRQGTSGSLWLEEASGDYLVMFLSICPLHSRVNCTKLGHVQLDFDCLQILRLHSLSGQSVSLFDPPGGEKHYCYV